MRGDLGASSSEVQFVISAYAGTYAVFLITGGRLGDLFGRRRMFLWGVAGFTIVSLCGVAWSPGNPGRRANPSRVCGDDVAAAGARLNPRAVSTR
jgi:MFS family permease